MNTQVMIETNAVEEIMEANVALMEKIATTFNFVGPRSKRADFCSDCCGSNGNDCVPQ